MRELVGDVAMRVRVIEAKIDSMDRRLDDLEEELKHLRDEAGKRRKRLWP